MEFRWWNSGGGIQVLNIAAIVDGSSNKNDMQERGWKAGTEKGIEKGWIAELKRHRRRGKAGWQGGMEWEWTRERAAIAKSGMKAEDESQHGKCGWKAVMKPA